MPLPSPEALYLQLGNLVAEMPDLANGPITPEMNRWLGRAAALVELAPCKAKQISLLRRKKQAGPAC
jgi:hypothetical protein